MNKKINKQNKTISKKPIPRYKYILSNPQAKGYTVLNEFICIECNSVNLGEEARNNQTELYKEREIKCRHCKKETEQICVKDKTIAKMQLELTTVKTEEQRRATEIIFPKKYESVKAVEKIKKR